MTKLHLRGEAGSVTEHDLSVEMPTSPLPVSPAASDDVGDRQHGTGIDTTFLMNANHVQQQEVSDDKLCILWRASASCESS